MENINLEIIVSSLLHMGYDYVDNLLLINTLGYICSHDKDHNFIFKDCYYSNGFYKNIIYDGTIFKLNDNIDKDNILNINNKLIDFLNEADFRIIIIKKIIISLNNYDLDNIDNLFCKKEKEIIRKLFNIPKEEYIKQKKLKPND